MLSVHDLCFKLLLFFRSLEEKVFDFLGQDLESKNTEQAAKKNEPSEYASSLPYDEDYNQDI